MGDALGQGPRVCIGAVYFDVVGERGADGVKKERAGVFERRLDACLLLHSAHWCWRQCSIGGAQTSSSRFAATRTVSPSSAFPPKPLYLDVRGKVNKVASLAPLRTSLRQTRASCTREGSTYLQRGYGNGARAPTWPGSTRNAFVYSRRSEMGSHGQRVSASGAMAVLGSATQEPIPVVYVVSSGSASIPGGGSIM